MTKDDNAAKKAARARQRATGERYTKARRNTARTQIRQFVDDCCANCLQPLPEEEEDKLFCSELCMQAADTIRHWRRVTRDGRIERPDVREAVNTRIAFLLAGGYHRQARQLSAGTRQMIWPRDAGLCRGCGKPGEEIDHTDGDSDDPANLQLLCKECHHAKTAERMVPASEDQRRWLGELIRTRVAVDPPRLLADDEVEWQKVHRRLKKARRDRLVAEMVEAGLDPNDFRGATRAEMVDELGDELAPPIFGPHLVRMLDKMRGLMGVADAG